LAGFVFEVRHVIPIDEAVGVELEAMAWRDGLKGKWRRPDRFRIAPLLELPR
jgi:hypothetical protein